MQLWDFCLGTQEQVLNSHGKQAISLHATGDLLYSDCFQVLVGTIQARGQAGNFHILDLVLSLEMVVLREKIVNGAHLIRYAQLLVWYYESLLLYLCQYAIIIWYLFSYKTGFSLL